MKQIYRIASIVFLFYSLATSVYSQEFTVDGITYNLSNGEAKVYKIEKSGAVTLPHKIQYNDIEYPVTSISRNANGNNEITKITIPSSIKEIEESAFYGCSNLQELVINDSSEEGLKNIGSYAFSGCKGLKKIKLPSHLEFIGDCAFAKSGLTEISIPSSTTGMGVSVFTGCASLKKIIFEDGNTTLKRKSYSMDLLLADGLHLDDVYVGRDISSSITFESCTIENLTIGTEVNEVRKTFYNCNAIKNIIINDSKQSLKLNKFVPERGSERVYIGRDIDIDANSASIFGLDIKEAEIGPNVLSICTGAFENCQKLEKVTISEGVRLIDNHAFYGCTSLETIHLPKTLTGIGYQCFVGCKRLKEIYCYAEECPGDKVSFDSYTLENAILYVPQGALESYNRGNSGTGYIRQFKNKVEMNGTSIDELNISENEVSWYSLNGTKLEQPKGKGIFLLRKNGKIQKVIRNN